MNHPVAFSLPATSSLHLITLFTLAVAHPLYDVLGNEDHSSFFTTHRAGSTDIWLLVVLLSFALPLAASLLLWSIRAMSRTLAKVVYVAILFALCSALFSNAFGRFLSGNAIAPAALTGAALACLFYVRQQGVRRFVTLMSPVVVLSPALFLSSNSVGSFLSPSEAIREDRIFSTTEIPTIVMIIFDELPQTSLLDENREIDAGRYPNFAELVGTSTWYRNTTALHNETVIAIPSILTGSDFFAYTRRQQLGDLSGKLDRRRIPNNLFSLFEDTHRIRAFEWNTDLAPVASAALDYRPSLTRRFPELLLHVSILYGHIAAPPPLVARLPALYGGWLDFGDGKVAAAAGADSWDYLGKRAKDVDKFIDLLQPPTQPTLYYGHLPFPHYPFMYNQVGQFHKDEFGIYDSRFRKAAGEVSWASETVADLAYQAHLLQLGFTDVLLGRIVARLKELELFDESLVVITSDHGTSFYWDEDGLSTQELAQVQAADTLYVPLIVKAPGQRLGSIIDRPVQLIDILPTIADMLDVEIPWVVDGISALVDTPTERAIDVYLTHHTRKGEFESLARAADRSLKRKIKIFGTRDIDGLYAYGPHKRLVGARVESFTAETSAATVKLKRPARFRNLDPSAPRLPAYVKGEIRNHSVAEGSELVVAIAINGVIASTTTTTSVPLSALVRDPAQAPDGDNVRYFLSRIPPTALAAGDNEVTVHGIANSQAGRGTSLIHFSPN